MQLSMWDAFPFPPYAEACDDLFLQGGDKAGREAHLNTTQVEFLSGDIKKKLKIFEHPFKTAVLITSSCPHSQPLKGHLIIFLLIGASWNILWVILNTLGFELGLCPQLLPSPHGIQGCSWHSSFIAKKVNPNLLPQLKACTASLIQQ